MRKTLTRLLAPGAVAISLSAIAAAPNDADLQQTATRQEQIRTDSQSIVSRLDEVIAEYTRNGLATGPDFEALKAVRDALGTLSDDEMEQVVTLLKTADTDRGQMSKAYATQKDISLRLKQILAERQLNQDIEALTSNVRQLADRQSANLSAAIDTQQLAAQDNSANGQSAVTASQQAQQSEQSSIGAEAKLIGDKLIQLAPGKELIDAGLELQHIEPEADAASDSLGAGKMDDAIMVEKVARQQLDEVARALTPAGSQETNPTRQAAQLADLARDQRDLLAQTARLASALQRVTDAESAEATDKALAAQASNPASALARSLAASGTAAAITPDQIRNAPAVKAWLAARAAALKKQEQSLQPQLKALAATQAALAAKAQLVGQDLQDTSKEAAVPMAAALAQMNAAQQSLAAVNGEQATRQEADAASQLDQAQRLAAQPAKSTAQALTPAQQLQQLQAGIKQLTARETTSLQQGDALKSGAAAIPAARQQESLAGEALALQQVAAAANSPSAQPLQQAADALQNASNLMRAGDNPTQAEAAQQSALQNLADAARQLAQQAAGIAQQKQDFAAMEKQMAGLDAVIQQQQQLALNTQKAVDEGNAGAPKARQFAQLQATAQKNTQNLRQSLTPTLPAAGKSLDHADAAMGDAVQKFSDQNVSEAQPAQQAALAALYQAQDTLADQLQKAAQSLDQSLAPAGAAVAAALAKAQTQTASAQDAMAATPGDDATHRAAVRLAQGARAITQAALQPQAIPQAARDALRNAQQSLNAAAASAAAGQSQQAQSQAADAGHAMEAAQSALGQDQAGIATMSPPSQAPPTDGQPSKSAGPGSNPGVTQAGSSASEKTWNDQGGAPTAVANSTQGPGQFQSLPDRDRAALQQSQSEKYPQEYGSMIEAYMRNLSTDSGAK